MKKVLIISISIIVLIAVAILTIVIINKKDSRITNDAAEKDENGLWRKMKNIGMQMKLV